MKSRHLEEFVEHNIGVGLTFHVYHDAHALTARLIVDITDSLDFLFNSQISDVFHQIGFVYTVRNLRYYNLVVGVAALNFGLGTHHYASSTCLIGVFHTLYTIYIRSRGKVGCLDVLHQSVGVYIRIVYIRAASVYDLAKVVCGDICCHTHCNTVAAVDQ